jgi:hypothetical protein
LGEGIDSCKVEGDQDAKSNVKTNITTLFVTSPSIRAFLLEEAELSDGGEFAVRLDAACLHFCVGGVRGMDLMTGRRMGDVFGDMECSIFICSMTAVKIFEPGLPPLGG